LVLGDAAATIGMTIGGTRPEPFARLAIAVSRVGSLSAALGSAILAVVAGIAVEAIVVVLIVIVYLSMANHLRKHLELVAREDSGDPPSWTWCLPEEGLEPPTRGL
jgi:hypothetical protein